jgi:hypothetical protein
LTLPTGDSISLKPDLKRNEGGSDTGKTIEA